MRKKVFLAMSLLIITLLISHCNIILYGIEQGLGQLKIVKYSRPIQSVLNDSTFADSLKTKIYLIQEIRQFATDSLGLKNSDNYTTLYDQKGKPILWVVTACSPYLLEPYQWKYPILGKLGYKGYFKQEKADKESMRLQKNGYDTNVGTVSAWSTLGYFKDPILSNMLTRSEGQLARLIIHELTHATLYIKGNSTYNENLATFVGDEGAKMFMEHKYGKLSQQYNDFMGEMSDIDKFTQHILRGANQMDSLYATFSINSTDTSIMQTKKEELIRLIIKNLDTIQFYNRERFTKWNKNDFMPNNTFFTSYRMYHDSINVFETEFIEMFNADFKKYLTFLKHKYSEI